MSQSSSEQQYSLPSQSRSPAPSDFTEEDTTETEEEDTFPHEDQLHQFARPSVVASHRSMIQRPRRHAVRAQLSAPAVAITDPLAVREEPLLPGYGCNTRCGSDVLRGAPLGVNPPAPHSGMRARNITQNHIRQAMYACTPWRVVRRNAHGAAEEAGMLELLISVPDPLERSFAQILPKKMPLALLQTYIMPLLRVA